MTQEIREAIKQFKQEAPSKLTVAYADTFAEMGNGTSQYYLASAFEKVRPRRAPLSSRRHRRGITHGLATVAIA